MGIIQGHHNLPTGLSDDFIQQMDMLLPGWNINGIYNFSGRANTQVAAAQLETFMHSGRHDWITKNLDLLITDTRYTNATDPEKTRLLAKVVNFMHEASADSALDAAQNKTNGFAAFTSLRDPRLLEKLGRVPSGPELTELFANEINWPKIEASDAGKAIDQLDVKLVNGKLDYGGKVDNGGFFSRTVSEVASEAWPTTSSSAFSASYRDGNNKFGQRIVAAKGGYVEIDGVAINQANADELLNTEFDGQTKIKDASTRISRAGISKIGSRLKGGGPILGLLGVVAVFTLAPDVAQAHTLSTYRDTESDPRNKEFIEELFAIAGGTLAAVVAGSIAGVATLGLAAIPVGVAAGFLGDIAGRNIGSYFYDNFTEDANNIAETLAPIFAPIGEALNAFGGTISDLAESSAEFAQSLNDAAFDIFNAVSDVFTEIEEFLTDTDGLFGINGPLFGGDGPLKGLVEFASEQGLLTGDGEWAYGGFDEVLRGGAGDDVLVLDEGTGGAEGGKGDDVILAIKPRFVRAGESLFGDEDTVIASEEARLTLDGGEGDDWVFALGGEGAIVVGGEGRDLLYNSSFKGQLWGDAQGDPAGRGGADAAAGDRETSDTFWWSAGSFIMDAGRNDRLQLFGIPVVGGSDVFWYGAGVEKGVARDFLLPWVTYGQTESGQLLIEANINQNLSPGMSEDEILQIAQIVQDWQPGDLGIELLVNDPDSDDTISAFRKAFAVLSGQLSAVYRFARNLAWEPADDPLVLDLNGDGFVTDGLGAAFFDQNGDGFAESSGWISGEDGFLAHDADGSGTIDDISELFGAPGVSGFTELAAWDSNFDGLINAEDARFDELLVWRDFNEDAITQTGELWSLDDLGITALSLTPQGPRDVQIPDGTVIRAESFFTRTDGSTGALGELIFETDRLEARYRGDNGIASWADDVNVRGYGRLTDLAIAASQDLRVADAIDEARAAIAAGITADEQGAPELGELRRQVQPILDAWSASQVLTRELTAVLVSGDGEARLDHAVYTEDASGGYWTLASGTDVLDTDGNVIARPALSDVLAQATTDGAGWQLTQIWSPAERDFVPQHRDETAYLTQLVDGVAQISDYAVRHEDAQGVFYTLASGNDILDADGNVIARASLDDVRTQAAAGEAQWRVEDFADAAVEQPLYDTVAFRIRDGIVIDYSITVQDGDESYAVWARGLQQALASQDRYGPASSGARGFAIDVDNLPDANNSDDSVERVEIVDAGQLRYAFGIYGIEFRPELFVATTGDDNAISYNADIDDTIGFSSTLINNYIDLSKGLAVRIAVQGELASYFEGVQYDPESDSFQATSGLELIPLFNRIFEDAPAGREEVLAYFDKWDDVLNVVYPDFRRNGRGPKSQAFLMQMVVAAFENHPVDAEFLAVAEALSIDEERVLEADGSEANVGGTRQDDLIYVGAGDKVVRGGLGSDVYVVGRDFGDTTIEDIEGILDRKSSDYLRFAHLTSQDVFAYREGADLIIEETGTANVLTVNNHFEGRRPGPFGVSDASNNTEIVEIVFADGVVWDFIDIAFAVSHPDDSDQVIIGSESIDVLDGGRGNDILRGGGDSDLYFFALGYGEDLIVDAEFNPFREHLDVVNFGEGISSDSIRLNRVGASNDLVIELLDEDGAATGDVLTIEGQFTARDAFLWTLRPGRIERFAFEDGTFLDDAQIRRRVIASARTDGEDAIFGFERGDSIDGGAGNDLLVGKNGADTYLFAKGYGHDVIEDQSLELSLVNPETENTLRFLDINADEIEILRDPGSQTISLRVTGTDDQVTLNNQFRVTNFGLFNLWLDNTDFVEFADGTIWDMDRLSRETLLLERTDGDDHIIGFDWSDILDGGAGNDLLEGGLYNDTYIFSRGYGHDTIFDSGEGRKLLLPRGYDRLQLDGLNFNDVTFDRTANDFSIIIKETGESVTLRGQYDRLGDTTIEEFVFEDLTLVRGDLNPEDIDLVGTSGDDVLRGTHYRETIDGRAGDDLLIGSSDGDIYLFDIGYGTDTIIDRIDSGFWRADDTVRFGADVLFDDTVFTKDGDDLVITFQDRTDQLRISRQFSGALHGIENFEFFDGTAISISDVEELLSISGGTRGDNVIVGFDDRENILDGRQGDDQLFGGRFSDTYLFGTNYGFDEITEVREADEVTGAADRVVFGELINPENVIVRRDGNDLVITMRDSGEQLRIIEGATQRLIESYDFADGTVWTEDDIRAALLRGTDGDDQLIGFNDIGDLLDGGLGNDDLQGLTGDDVYRFGIGYGQDSIRDLGGVDRIELGENILPQMLRFAQDGDNLIISLEGFDDSLVIFDGLKVGGSDSRIEAIILDDGFEFSLDDVRESIISLQATTGDDIVTGFAGRDDIIRGSGGDDELVGLSGNDTYIVSPEDEFTIIDDRGSSASDSLVIQGRNAADALVRRVHPERDDITISFAGSQAEILIKGALNTFDASAIEELVFDDGTIWSIEELRAQAIATQATENNDIINGFSGTDNIAGGRGDDILRGFGGADQYEYSFGDGHDIIEDRLSTNSDSDVDRLKINGYSSADIVLNRVGPGKNDIEILFPNQGDSLTIYGQLDTAGGSGLEEIEFSDGVIWNRATIAQQLGIFETDDPFTGGDGDDVISGHNGTNILSGNIGDDTLNGLNGNDILIGGADNDRLVGGAGNDTYRFSLGFGQDTIVEGGGSDTVEFDASIAPEDLEVYQPNSRSLILRVKDSDDSVLLTNSIYNTSARVERVLFSDGTVWSHSALMTRALINNAGDDRFYGSYSSDTINGGSGNDVLFGYERNGVVSGTRISTEGNDVITGGPGNDFIRGATGNDTYLYSIGFGQDTINEGGGQDGRQQGTETIVFDETITTDDIEVFQSGSRSLILRVIGTEDQITLVNSTYDVHHRVERVRFADGTVWSHAELMRRSTLDNGGDDLFYGSFSSDTITGGAGNDSLFGYERNGVVSGTRISTEGNDVIIGGAGNDFIRGASGNDTYRFSAGFGKDVINEGPLQDGRSLGTDTVVFDDTISKDQIIVNRIGNHIVIKVAETEDQITIINQALGGSQSVERFAFADGTVWSAAQLASRITAVPNGIEIVGGDLGQRIEGLFLADTLTGGAGDDIIFGDSLGVTGDNLIVNGSFEDVAVDAVAASFGTRATSLPGWIRVNDTQLPDTLDIEQVNSGVGGVFSTDGNFWLDLDGFGNDVNGRESNLHIEQSVSGIEAGDALLLEFDHANRRSVSSGGFEVLWNGEVIAAYSDVSTVMQHGALRVVAVEGENTIGFRGIGTTDDVGASLDNVQLRYLSQSPEDVTVNLSPGEGDTISGNAGNDQLFGEFGNDHIDGGIGNDLIEGGSGDDTLLGGDGDDSYIFSLGDGQDRIEDNSGFDRLLFDETIAPEDVRARSSALVSRIQSGNTNLTLLVKDGTDRITLVGALTNGNNVIEEVEFANGTIWTHADLVAKSRESTDGVDDIYGAEGNDVLSGGLGNDVLRGLDGDDELSGGANNDSLIGGNGSDVLAGGSGDDTLTGDAGDDLYRFNRGDGQDRITDSSGVDRIEFGPTIAPGDIFVRHGGTTNLSIRILDTEDRITLVNALSNSANAIEELHFSDGTIWTHQDLLDRALLPTDFRENITGTSADENISGGLSDDILSGGSGNDLLSGGQGNDTLNGGAGDDVFVGGAGADAISDGAGNDVYRFDLGDGQDSITDSGGIDRVELATGILASDVTVTQRRSLDIELRIGVGNDRIRIRNALNSPANIIEEVRFDDGTVWDFDELFRRSTLGTVDDDNFNGTLDADELAGAAGNDQLSGNDGDDILRGDEGEDLLEGGSGSDRLVGGLDSDSSIGGAGSDTYVFAAGDGRDIIEDNGGDGIDIVEISGYAANDATFRRFGSEGEDLVLRFEGSDDQILILNGLSGELADTIEEIHFVDGGEAILLSEILDRLASDAATSGADVIEGTAGNDILTGGAGFDILIGGSGDDIYEYRAGDGDDRIEDSSGNDLIRLLNYSVDDIVTVDRSPPSGDDLILSFATTGDRLVVRGALSLDEAAVENIQFSDGTVWSASFIRETILSNLEGDDDRNIWGFASNDILAGGRGRDRLSGAEGDDVYRYAAGDGQDQIEDNGNGFDRIILTDYTSAQVTAAPLYRGDTDNVVLRFAGAPDDELTIWNIFDGSEEDTIEEIEFADGVVWTPQDLLDVLGNRAPSTRPDGFETVTQGQQLSINPLRLLANDFDADNDPLSIVAVSANEGGSVEIGSDGNILFTADPDYTGTTTFTYTASDGRNGLTEETVRVRVRPEAFANDDSGINVNEDETIVIRSNALLANDVDGDRMEISQVLDAVNGSVSLASNGDITFTPTANFNGEATFRYVANTFDGGRAEATVTLTVLPVNDNPIARNDDLALATDEEVAFTFESVRLVANDSDIDGDTLAVQSVAGDGNILAELDENGLVNVTPIGDFFGTAQLSYVVSDGNGGLDNAQVSVIVRPINDAPLPSDDTRDAIEEDNLLFFDGGELLVNDTDPDGDLLQISSVSGGPNGSAELFPNGTILYTPETNFFGSTFFTYTVDDGQGARRTARVAIEVTPVNDRPTAQNESGVPPFGRASLRADQDTVLAIGSSDLLANDFDIDSAGIEFVSVANAINGDVEFRDDGQVYFTPDEGFWGEASFTYLIRDSEGLVDDATVSLYFRPTGPRPAVANDDFFTAFEDQEFVIASEQLLANDFDPNGDQVFFDRIFGAGASSNGISSYFINDDGDLVVRFVENTHERVSLRYSVTDNISGGDSAVITINVQPTADAPTATNDLGFETSAGRPLVIRIADITSNDYDIDSSVWRPGSGFAHAFGARDLNIVDYVNLNNGVLSTYNDEFVVIELDESFTGAVEFDYILSDPTGLTSQANALGNAGGNFLSVIEGTNIRDLLIGTAQGETIVGLDGVDDLYGRAGDDILRGGDDADLLDGGDGFDIADYTGSNIGLRADLLARIGQGGHAQGDEYVSIEGIEGSDFADQLFGNLEANYLSGAGGSDYIEGNDGKDQILGGGGNDRLIGGNDADVLDGGDGIDTADYSFSLDAVTVDLTAGTGLGGEAEGDTLINVENVVGTQESDIITGNAEDNELIGGRGDDQLLGLGGNDVLNGGRGADVIDGGEGVDAVDYLLSQTGVNVDLSSGIASGGDADGDVLTNIENILGSFHDDILTGSAGNNVIRGGSGADLIDGGEGIDTADYSLSSEAVTVNLATGLGSRGEAEGDQLFNIENLVGSIHADILVGNALDNYFNGGFGDDLLAGGAGSDTYFFDEGSSSDTIQENDNLGDIDRLLLGDSISRQLITLVRENDDLFVELEDDAGFTIDTVRIEGQFSGSATGIEEIVFADGIVWDRSEIDSRYSNGRINAVDDIVRFATEDVAFDIDPALLIENDTDDPDVSLSIVQVRRDIGGDVEILSDGMIRFAGDQDFNGDAFFSYTATDGRGRFTTARVELTVLPTNDAPFAQDDGVFTLREDELFNIPFAWLLGNDGDIDGDNISIVDFAAPLDEDGNAFDGRGNADLSANAGFVVFDPEQDYSGEAAFSYIVADASGASARATVRLNITPVDDAPRARGDDFTIRSGFDLVVNASDLLGNDFDPEGDPFAFVDAFRADNGSIQIEEVAGQKLIRFTPDANFIGDASFRYSIQQDGSSLASEGTVSINVLPPNDPPVASDDSFSAVEDEPLVIAPADLLANDSDPNGDALFISSLDPFPENGSVAFDADGNVVFTPDPNYNGPASFHYFVSDGEFSRRANVSINVEPQNDAPVAIDDGPIVADEDKVIVLRAADIFANDSDEEGDLLSFHSFGTTNGNIELDGQDLLLTPSANFSGEIIVSYQLQDENGAVSNQAQIFVQVENLPDLPIAATDNAVGLEDTELFIDPATLLLNDSDADGDMIEFVRLSDSANGTVQMVDGQIVFTPDPDFFGEASFQYIITDNIAGESTGLVLIDVANINDVPILGSDVFDGFEDTELVISAFDILANDVDADGDILTITSVSPSTEGGSAFIDENGDIHLTPPLNANDFVIFEYFAEDPSGAISRGEIRMFAEAVNDAPTLAMMLSDISSSEDGSIDFALPVETFNDVDGDVLSISAELAGGSALPSWLSFDGQRFFGTPPRDFNGILDIRVTASDAEFSVDDTFHLEITPQNDAPVVMNQIEDVSFPEDTAINLLLPQDTFSDVDGDSLTVAVTLGDGTALPAWLIFENGAISGTPPENFNGPLDIAVTASDGELSVTEGFVLTIDPVNDAPVVAAALADLTSPEDTAIDVTLPAGTFSDVDGDALTLTASLADGTALPSWLNFADGRFTGTPPQDFNGSLELSVTANDGELSVSDSFLLTIDPINDAPVLAVMLSDIASSEDAEVNFALPVDSFTDVDGDALALTATLADGTDLPDWLAFDGTNFTGTPPQDFNGPLDIRITASDGELSVADSFILEITPQNDAPTVAVPLADISSPEDGLLSVDIPLSTFADVDGDALSISVTLGDGSALPAWLSFENGALAGTPPQDFNGSLNIAVTADDGELSVTESFVLTVDPVNDAPIVINPIADAASDEDASFVIALPGDTFADVDGDALTLTALQTDGNDLPDWISFDGQLFGGTPPLDFNGTLEITVTASDGELSVSDSFLLTIDPINDAPIVLTPLSDIESPEDIAINAALPNEAFADVDADALSFTAALTGGGDLPDWLSFDGEAFTGTPPADFNGAFDIEVTASDGALSVTDSFRLTITPVNDAPVVSIALLDSSSAEDTAIDITLPAGSFTDIDSVTLALTAALTDGSALPAWLNFDGAARRFTGLPSQDFNGVLDIRVTASDGEFEVSDNFALTITPANDAPVANIELTDFVGSEDTAFSLTLPADAFADVDGDTLSLSAALADGSDLPAWLSFDGVTFTGIPPQDFNGSIGLEVTASDGALSASQNFNLVFDPVNDAPVLVSAPSFASPEDQGFDIELPSDAFADVDGDSLTFSAALADGSGLPAWLTFNGERFTGTPPADFNGTLDLQITASDGAAAAVGDFTFTITPVNDAPVATDDDVFLSDSGDVLTILQSSLLENDVDIDGDTLTITSLSNGANGTAGFDADGNVTYTPDAGFAGDDSFTYTVSDGALEATATVNVSVENPFAGWRQGTEGRDFLFGNFFRENEIFARGGNDRVFGGFRTDYLAGGAGNDRIFGLWGNDHLWGNEGNDILFGGFGTDTAYFAGDRDEYVFETLAGGFYIRSVDIAPGANGDDGRDQLISIERLSFRGGETISVASPIILDLDGDGSEVVSAAESNALFDLDGDGVGDDTAWIGSGDAFLFIDRDGSGSVTGVEELSFVDDVEDARSDLDGLRSFDSNSDGILNAQDERFAEFGVWQDLNTDGQVDAGEIRTLDEAGISSLDLNATPTEEGFTHGDVAILNRGGFTRNDGSVGSYVDAAITFFEQGVPELPNIEFRQLNFANRSGHYDLQANDGTLSVVTRSRGLFGLFNRWRGRGNNIAVEAGNANLFAFGNETIGMLSPIVLDLDGDGLELRRYQSTRARFDIDGNGSRDDTGWIGRDDGFLVVDRNRNGIIDNGAELSFLAEAPEATSDLQALRNFDSSGDGRLDAGDVRFGELKVWQDRNSNGITDAGELRTLEEAGITSFDLNGRATNERVRVGRNITLATSSFTRSDGSTSTLGDVALAFRPSAALPPSFASYLGGNAYSSYLNNAVTSLRQFGLGRFGFFTGTIPASFYGTAFASEAEQTQSSEIATLANAANDESGQPNADPDTARLALMTQDIATFGANGTGEIGRNISSDTYLRDFLFG